MRPPIIRDGRLTMPIPSFMGTVAMLAVVVASSRSFNHSENLVIYIIIGGAPPAPCPNLPT